MSAGLFIWQRFLWPPRRRWCSHKERERRYAYDAIGNLIGDLSEGITNIDWTVYGKIQDISKASGNIAYTYDAGGNRMSKTVNGKGTWYVRDATGNVMAVYAVDPAVNGGSLTQTEVDKYGSGRLGVLNTNVNPAHVGVPISSPAHVGVPNIAARLCLHHPRPCCVFSPTGCKHKPKTPPRLVFP